MSTAEERATRAELQDAQLHRRSLHVREYGALAIACLLVILAATNPTMVDEGARRGMCYLAAGCLVVAGFYNLYIRVMLAPRINALQTQLNRFLR